MINILIPVHNEEKILKNNILKLRNFLDNNLKNNYKLFIVDGKSEDNTETIGRQLDKEHKNITYLRTNIKGKGAQLKKACTILKGDYFAFVDVDFPIKFEEILQVFNAIIGGKGDLIIGTRNIGNKKIDRPIIRKITSRAYNIIANIFLNMSISDLQCGIKAWNSKVNSIWSKVRDEKWFFDTELLYHSIREGHKILEIPVSYSDRRKESKVFPIKDSFYFIKRLLRLKFRHQ